MFDRTPLEERLVMLVYVTGKPHHIQVLRGTENLTRSFSHPFNWGGEVVSFSRDVVESMLLPTVKISKDWWSPTHRKVLT